MFESLLGMGPYTWAVIVLLVFAAFGAVISRGGTVRFLIGGLISAFALGGILQIAAYQGFVVPIVNLSAGVTGAMLMIVLVGFSLLSRGSQASGYGESASLRDRLPQVDGRSFIGYVLGGVLIIVALVTLFGSLNLSFDPSGRGTDIAQREFNAIGNDAFRRIEQFLAR